MKNSRGALRAEEELGEEINSLLKGSWVENTPLVISPALYKKIKESGANMKYFVASQPLPTNKQIVGGGSS